LSGARGGTARNRCTIFVHCRAWIVEDSPVYVSTYWGCESTNLIVNEKYWSSSATTRSLDSEKL
jgi:hypothetical protein